MKVGFEAKRFFTNYTGLGNYSRFIVDALSTFAPENDYLLYTPRRKSNPEVDSITSRKNISVVTPTGFYSFASSAWRTFGIGAATGINEVKIFHGLSQELPFNLPRTVRKIVTVHDLIFLRYPKLYNPIDVAIYKVKVKSACQRADRIIAISTQTADDIVEFLKIDPEKISVVYQGCHPAFKVVRSMEERAVVRKKYNLPERYILNVGTIEYRKNVGLLIKALTLLPKSLQIPVVIVGRATSYVEAVLKIAKESGVADKIILIHNSSFADLPAIYQQAEIFVYPSLFEGFGIPLVEAIESGLPVITSTGSCFSEAAGPSSVYVEPGDSDALGDALKNLLENKDRKVQMVNKSRDFIRRFSPENIAGEILKAYNA